MSDLYNGEKWYQLAIISRDWNEESLVENTIDAQYKKLAEEIEEYKNAKRKDSREKEAADVFITFTGLLRWIDKDLNTEVVAQKLDKLKQRNWMKQKGGTYHH